MFGYRFPATWFLPEMLWNISFNSVGSCVVALDFILYFNYNHLVYYWQHDLNLQELEDECFALVTPCFSLLLSCDYTLGFPQTFTISHNHWETKHGSVIWITLLSLLVKGGKSFIWTRWLGQPLGWTLSREPRAWPEWSRSMNNF